MGLIIFLQFLFDSSLSGSYPILSHFINMHLFAHRYFLVNQIFLLLVLTNNVVVDIKVISWYNFFFGKNKILYEIVILIFHFIIMKTVFVTGATGYLGSHITQNLLLKNFKVIAHSRSKIKFDFLK